MLLTIDWGFVAIVGISAFLTSLIVNYWMSRR